MVDLRSLLRRRWGITQPRLSRFLYALKAEACLSRKNLVTQRLEIPTGFEEIQFFAARSGFPTSGRRPTEVMFRYRKVLARYASIGLK